MQDAALSENFNTFMTGTTGAGKSYWINWFPVQTHILDTSRKNDTEVLLVDVGGGHGQDLDRFISTYPDAKGRYVLEDLPAVVQDYQHGNPRIEPVKHDFFKPQPIKGQSQCLEKSKCGLISN